MMVDKIYSDNKEMQLVIERTAYYRANPHRFVIEYLGIHLKLFQVFIIYAMNFCTNIMYLASRGQGKQVKIEIIFCPHNKQLLC